MKTTGDQQLVKRINRSVLLRLLRQRGGLSRAQLASESGLTKSTVSLLVRELIEEGWITETSLAAAQGLGRPSTPLQLDGSRRAMLGVEIGVESLRVVGVSLTGEVLWSAEEPLADRAPGAVCGQVAALAVRAHGELAARPVLVSGMGIGVPGAFDEATGTIRFAPNLGWRDVAFLPLMARALAEAGSPSVAMHVQNEADTAALSEYEFAGGEATDSLIFVTCGVGVGAGIVLNDRLFTGLQGMAGEIGHSILQIDGPACSCGRKGCAETFLGARALERQAEPARGGVYLGVVLQNLWTTFNPGVLVVGGPSCERYPDIVRVARETLQGYAASAGMAAPRVRSARYGLLASAVGAAALVLHHELRPMHAPAVTAPPDEPEHRQGEAARQFLH
ncbi:ROK family transcriptional regulator [Acidovorax sp. A1169]|uniref:ROK family transcriptional regulator n=1 Tax=Acidovorax sp. A1169 TaxID=3059524 RepID=UPI00273791A1|nr:ROK family transcriptional regulator [Acidovorax sp. A1169]MDP4074296.1 ROK family transcriptional regulator [Acidovorax sp. A1169]